jgi:hypothetical protein
MAVTHAKVSGVADDGDPTKVQPSDWNASHVVTDLDTTSVSGTDAATTMATESFYRVDMSGWTADRNYTLPASPTVGDRVGVMVTAGSASWELIVKGNTSQTINGGSTASEWSRLFITGEVVILRYVASNAWMVEYDGRIAQKGLLRLSTAPSANEAAATFVYPTSAAPTAGVWTADTNIGACTDVSLGKISTRRACRANLSHAGATPTNVTDQKYWGTCLEVNGNAAIQILQNTLRNPLTGLARAAAGVTFSFPMATDDYVRFMYRSEEGSKGLVASTILNNTYFSFEELL